VPAIIAGFQSGKSTFLAYWLRREIQRKGAGQYFAISPTLRLFTRQMLLHMRDVFCNSGWFEYVGGSQLQFRITELGEMAFFGTKQQQPTTIFVLYATDPDALESMVGKGGIADEAGQSKYSARTFEAIFRRLNVHNARLAVGTTPYEFNAFKTRIYDRWANGDTSIEVFNFASTMNPAFSLEHFLATSGPMPEWRRTMMLEGKFTRPAGSIYDCFDEKLHTVPRFKIPKDWPRRYLGIDFGPMNTAALMAAKNPKTAICYIYRSYKQGGVEVEDHAREILKGGEKFIASGGALSEDDYRRRYYDAGLPIHRPKEWSVEDGISRVWTLIKSGHLMIFDDLEKLISEIRLYSRELDDDSQPTLKIADKATFHRADALRYLVQAIYHDDGRPIDQFGTSYEPDSEDRRANDGFERDDERRSVTRPAQVPGRGSSDQWRESKTKDSRGGRRVVASPRVRRA